MTGSRLRPAFIVGLFLGLLTVSLQGVQGEEELEVPPEDLCRPYIEKALKDLGTGSLEQTSTEVGVDVNKESHEDEPPAASEEAGESAGDASAEDLGTEEEKQESVEDGAETAGSAEESQDETGAASTEVDQSAEDTGEQSAEDAGEQSAEAADGESAEAAEEQSAEAADEKSAEAAEDQSGEVVAEESAEGATDQSAEGAEEKSAEVVKPKEGFLEKVWNILMSKSGPKTRAVPAPTKESEEQEDKSAEAVGEGDKNESAEEGKEDSEGSDQAEDDASEKSVEDAEKDEGKSDEDTADEQSDEEAKTIEEKSDEESQVEDADEEVKDETVEEESTDSQAAEDGASEEEGEVVEEGASKEDQASAEASAEEEEAADEASKQEEGQSEEAPEVSAEGEKAESAEQDGDTSAEAEVEDEQKQSDETEGVSDEVVEGKSAEEEVEAQSTEAEDDGKSAEEEAEGKSAEEEGEEGKSAEDDADAKSVEDESGAKSGEEEIKSGEEEANVSREDAKSEEEEAKSGDEEAKSEEDETKSGEDEAAPSAEEEETKSAEEEVKSGEEEAKSAEEATSAEEEAKESGTDEPSEEEPVEAVKSRARREVGSEQAEGEADEADEGSDEETAPSEEEPTPEEDLIQDIVIPDNLRSRDHINQLLRLDEENEEKEKAVEKIGDIVLRDLKKLYDNAIQPLESLYKYRDLSNRHFGDPEIFSKPLVLFMGPWSGGKSSIINYLLDIEYKPTSLRTGAEPSPAYFNILMYGEEEEILDGTQLAADWTFSGLQKFGQGMLDRLRGLRLNNKLLEKVNIVEIPGILEIRKQVQRLFPFNDACQWFIDRADIIFLVYDPSKLDVGPETEAILDQLKGRETQTRIILNKADQVKPEELMRVQGALIWNISPLMSSAEPPVMYSTSLWSLPYEAGAPTRLLYAQERAFLRDLRTAVDKRVEHKIASARRFAVRVRNHAKMVDCYLTTYYNHKTFFGNKKEISDKIIENPQDYHIYEGLSTLTNISRYDLPDPDVYRDFFRLNSLYDFQLLSSTCTYFRGCPINRLDVAIAYDLPELVGKYRKQVEQVIHEYETSSPPS